MKLLKLSQQYVNYASLVAIALNLTTTASFALIPGEKSATAIAQNTEIRDIQVETIPQESSPQPVTNAENREPVSSSSVKIPVAIPSLLSVEGVLEKGDQVIPADSSFYDTYTIEGSAGQEIKIDLVSQDFDTYLAILDPTGKIIAENDDLAQGNSNSQITLKLPSDGSYRLIVNSYSDQGQGKYTITANTLSNPPQLETNHLTETQEENPR
jgi:hypothetical protein